MGKIIVPSKNKKVNFPKDKKEVTSVFNFMFKFNKDEPFNDIVDRLDRIMNEERMRAVKALAKYLKVNVTWSETNDKTKEGEIQHA